MSQVVVSDATPLNYLALIDAINLLPRLYPSVLIPPAVALKLSDPKSPAPVSRLVLNLPSWLEIQAPTSVISSFGLDAGESEAIALAKELGIEAILMDERKGRRVAIRQGLSPIGTLAILERAASSGWIDFREFVDRLRTTNFRFNEQLADEAKERLKPKPD